MTKRKIKLSLSPPEKTSTGRSRSAARRPLPRLWGEEDQSNARDGRSQCCGSSGFWRGRPTSPESSSQEVFTQRDPVPAPSSRRKRPAQPVKTSAPVKKTKASTKQPSRKRTPSPSRSSSHCSFLFLLFHRLVPLWQANIIEKLNESILMILKIRMKNYYKKLISLV